MRSGARIHLALHPVAAVHRTAAGCFRIQGFGRSVSTWRVGPGVRAALRRLAGAGMTEDALSDLVLRHDGGAALPAWFFLLAQAESAGLLCRVLVIRGRPVARARFATGAPPRERARAHVLSRFAILRREGDIALLESARSPAAVELLDPRAGAVLAAMTSPGTMRSWRTTSHAPAAWVEGLATLLQLAGMLRPADDSGRSDEDRDPALTHWELADALLHAASRDPRRAAGFGGSYPGRDTRPPLPAVKPPMSAETIALARPEAPGAAPPLFDTLAARRSVRRYGRRPITLQQLGEFLWHSARVMRTIAAARPELPYDATLRPSPSGGACHPLKLYVAAGRCEGLPVGLYHYDPAAHRLELLRQARWAVRGLLAGTRLPVPRYGARQVLIVLTARFGRTSWKYRGMAYTVVLKDVGALLQTMYLVATAMGLAPCAVGAGDGGFLARAIGVDPMEEGAVGEFMLGSRP